MKVDKLNPSDGQMVPGCVVDEHSFTGRVTTAHLFKLAQDPRLTEDCSARASDPDLKATYELREEVQRLFTGAKLDNVEPYCKYLLDVYRGTREGAVPAMMLWSPQELKFTYPNDPPLGYIQVPHDLHLTAIDGETQLAARYLAASAEPGFKQAPAAVTIYHGRSIEWAKQAFHDLNILGVQPNAAKAIATTRPRC